MQRLIPAATTALRLRRGNPPPGLFSIAWPHGFQKRARKRGYPELDDGFEFVQDVQRFLEFFFYGGLASELV